MIMSRFFENQGVDREIVGDVGFLSTDDRSGAFGATPRNDI